MASQQVTAGDRIIDPMIALAGCSMQHRIVVAGSKSIELMLELHRRGYLRVPFTGNYFHLHLVSDSTGETLITVARAVAAQYANVTPVEHVYPLVRSQKQLDRVLDEIEESPGIVPQQRRPTAAVQRVSTTSRSSIGGGARPTPSK